MAETIVEVQNLKKLYPVETGLLTQLFGEQEYIHAVDGIDIEIERGEIFGLAGESGCGKTTTGRCLAMLDEPTDGQIRFEGNDVSIFQGSELQSYRRNAQMVFQDPYESINDRFTVRRWVREPLSIHGIGSREEKENRVWEALEQSGLVPVSNFLEQYPHELSGGQRQRVALARALVLNPDFIIADEPTSMLDVSVRAGILNVLQELVEENDVTILYISHDLSLLRYICDRIGIMYNGEIMEIGDANAVLRNPQHPYTQSLLTAVPRVNPLTERPRVNIPPDVEERIGGVIGCPFKDRCQYQFDKCDEKVPMYEVDEEVDQLVSCHLYDESVDRSLPTYKE